MRRALAAPVDVDSETLLGIVGDGGFGILHALVARAFADRRAGAHRTAPRAPRAGSIARHRAHARRARRRGGARNRRPHRGPGSRRRRGEHRVASRLGGRAGLGAARRHRFALRRLAGRDARLVRGGAPALRRGTARSVRFTLRRAPCAKRSSFWRTRKLDVEPLISERFALASVADAFASLDTGHGLKYAIVP